MLREGDTCGNYSMKVIDYIFTDKNKDDIKAYCEHAHGKLGIFYQYVILPIPYKILRDKS